MAGERTLTVKILGDASGAQKAFAKLEKDSEGIGDKLGKVGAAVGKVFVGAGVAAGAFGVKAVLSASDLAETMSKVGVVFGDQQKIVTGFANQMAKDFGTPKREILDAAASIGLIGKASGLSQGDAAKMSTQLAKMAADASSFYNVPLPEALQAIQSGLVGEAEPMRRFGVLLNAQAVDAEAARLGLEKVNGAYTEGAKAQARASLIMAGMTDASGDLERTQGSLANRLKELRGRAENFAADVGTKLLPIVLKAFDVFERLAGSLQSKLAPVFRVVGVGLRALVSAFKEGDVTSDGFVGVMERLGVIARKVADFIANNTTPVFVALGVVLGGAVLAAVAGVAVAVAGLLSPFVLITGAIALAVAGVVYAYQRFDVFRETLAAVSKFVTDTIAPAIAKFAGYLTQQLGAAVEWVRKIWPQISETIGHVINVAAGIIRSTIDTISALWRAWGDDLLRVARHAFELIRGTIDNVLQVIRGIITTFFAILNGDWGKAWDGIKQIFAGIWDQIVSVLRTAIGVLGSVVGGIVSTFGEILRPLGNLLHKWIVEPIEAIIRFIRDSPGKIASAAAGMFDGIKNAFRAAINFIIRGWNGLQFKVPSIDLPGLPKFGGQTIGMPDIPLLAHGGIVKARPGGTLALLGEAGQDEAVIPLPRGGALASSAAVNITVNVPNYVGDRTELMRVVVEELRRLVGRGVTLGIS